MEPTALHILREEVEKVTRREDLTATAMWNIWKDRCTELRETYVPKRKSVARKVWMTEEILSMMEEPRKVKNQPQMYKILNKRIKLLCKEAKIKYFEDQCYHIENSWNRNPRDSHKKIKDVTGKRRNNNYSSVIKDEKGTVLMDENKILDRWCRYIKQLYGDDTREKRTIEFSGELSGLPILRSEIKTAITSMKSGRACGQDSLPIEFIVKLGASNIDFLVELMNKIYEEGKVPQELRHSVFIALPKKPKAQDCENFRTISLMSHVTKILQKELLNRMKGTLRAEIAECQYGFLPDKSTRNAIFILRVLAERSIQVNQTLRCCFIDYTKAFDRVQHNILFEILNDLDLADKDLRLLQDIYFNQTANIRFNNATSESVCVEVGVRQDDGPSPDLFSVYSEKVMDGIKEETGVTVNGQIINNVRFADDAVLLALSQEDLQRLVDIINERCKKFGMEINVKKTVVMAISKEPDIRINVTIDGKELRQVDHFKYLGSFVTTDCKSNMDIRTKVAEAKRAFGEMKTILTNNKIPLPLRMPKHRCYVEPIMLYGCETWTLLKKDKKKLESTEMWFMRRMLKVKWTEKATNDEVLRRMNNKRRILETIARRQTSFFAHVMRKEKLEQLVVTGKIPGKKSKGKQRRTIMDQIKDWAGTTSTAELMEKIRNRTLSAHV